MIGAQVRSSDREETAKMCETPEFNIRSKFIRFIRSLAAALFSMLLVFDAAGTTLSICVFAENSCGGSDGGELLSTNRSPEPARGRRANKRGRRAGKVESFVLLCFSTPAAAISSRAPRGASPGRKEEVRAAARLQLKAKVGT